MSVTEEQIDLPVDEGTMAVTTYRDDDGEPRPAVVLVHDANGLSQAMLDLARGLAEQGFVVATPDTFHRAGRMQIGDPAAGIEANMWLREGMTNTGHISDMNALARHLQSQSYVQPGLVGITGFCLGGRISFLAASQGVGFGPSVLFYPTRLHGPDPAIPGSPHPIEFSNGVTNPMLIFFPSLDPQNPPDKIALIRDALADAPVESIVVDNAVHGFAHDGGRFDPEKGPPAWNRCVDFFVEHLKATAVRR